MIFGITFQVVGYLLINFAYGNAIEQEKRLLFRIFNITDISCNLYCIPIRSFFLKKETEAENILNSFSVPVAVYGVDGKYFFSNLAAQPGELDLVEADDNRISFRIYEKDERNYIFVSNDVEVKR